jgi:hypothetical protein
MEPSSVESTNSLVHVNTKRPQTAWLEVEGEPIAAGCPKCHAPVEVAAHSEKTKGNRKK